MNKEKTEKILNQLMDGITWDKVNINNYAFFLSADDYTGIKNHKGFPVYYMTIVEKGKMYFCDRNRIYWNG